jgi:hypothetical protein
MATIKKAQKGLKQPKYSNINLLSWTDKPTSKDSADYRSGYFKGVSDIKKGLPKSKTQYDPQFGMTQKRLGYAEAYEKPKRKTGGTVTKAKGGKWIQSATASIKRRGTEGVCTGSKFGGPTCKPGSKRYNLAKTFRKMAKKK